MGNSLFVFKFDDNYSAGEKVIRGEVLNKLIQDYVPYTDEYGEVYKMKVSFAEHTELQEVIMKKSATCFQKYQLHYYLMRR